MPHVDYYENGVWFPSVTDILGDKPKPWLDAWREKWGVLAERKTECATKIGSAFHEKAEGLVKGLDVAASGRVYGMLEKFDRWTKESGLVIKETELHVVSHKYMYSGTFDATGYLAENPKALCLFDWKTSSGIYPDMQLQLVAYAQAYFEQTGAWPKAGIIVHVSKDKPHHKLTVKSYKLGKRLLNKFLKRLKEFNEART